MLGFLLWYIFVINVLALVVIAISDNTEARAVTALTILAHLIPTVCAAILIHGGV